MSAQPIDCVGVSAASDAPLATANVEVPAAVADAMPVVACAMAVQQIVSDAVGQKCHNGGTAYACLRKLAPSSVAESARRLSRTSNRERHGMGTATLTDGSFNVVAAVKDALSCDKALSGAASTVACSGREGLEEFFVGESTSDAAVQAVVITNEQSCGDASAKVDEPPLSSHLVERLCREADVPMAVATWALKISGGLFHPAKRRLVATS